MRKMFESISILFVERTFSHNTKTAWMCVCALLLCMIRVTILRPLFLLCCAMCAVMAAVPVAVFVSPSFTTDVLAEGVLRTASLLPSAYVPLCLAGLLFEVIHVVRGLMSMVGYWSDYAVKDYTAQGRGR
ncbi:hypothetical protein [Lonsdalea populi]|uniref:hypothetical protein n=1 Tax=Lonsdalea populi TaxID=1172565 RepID=UPI000A1F63A7|nr:hypothetical protein [Lonsdalea populi]OSN01317.1 hypothetical protein AU499_07330 [Lonsdalea populi]QPQ24952.1 hypothetical protein I6N93_03895 [Lonsdalea populi]RAT41652.1 hypothetical protein AU495_13950 [Lonsdalea populi]RAT43923.1 hypothetical protein AU494_07890 [Lonsdalea populi]RAT57500.1 hypothetical protein AU500_05705 [Lonsdalea populi]